MRQTAINRLILLITVIYAIDCNFSINRTCSNSFTWDSFGYYAYLPATFIQKDISIKDLNTIKNINEKYSLSESLYQFNSLPNGNHPIRYSCGIALLSAPFFIGSHLFAIAFKYPLDGYSYPYQFGFNLSNLFWFIIGIIFFNKLLKKIFSISTTNLILITVIIGTNFLHSTTKSFGSTHLFEFTFFSILITQIIEYYKNPNSKNAVLVGLCLGIITVIRPVNLFAFIIFLFWDINPINLKEIASRFKFFSSKYRSIILIVLSLLIAILPQIIYWKYVTEQFLYQGYDNPGEGLDLLNPHTFNFLFSFRKGWLLYSPLMLFSIVGIYYMKKENWKTTNTLILFILINTYLLSSWTCWWYAASYGQRTMFDTYPILAIPLGFFIQNIQHSNLFKKYLFYSIGFILVSWNVFRMWQFDNAILHFDSETKPHFINNLFSIKHQNDDSLLLIPRGAKYISTINRSKKYTQKRIYQNSFDFTDMYFSIGLLSENKRSYFKIDSVAEFTNAIKIPYSELTNKTHAYVKISFDCKFKNEFNKNKFSLVEHFEHDEKAYYYFNRELNSINNFDSTSKKWNHYEFYILTPEVRDINDNFVTYFWNHGHNEILIDNLIIESFEPIFDPK